MIFTSGFINYIRMCSVYHFLPLLLVQMRTRAASLYEA